MTDATNTLRLNARLDASLAKKVAYLKTKTRGTTTEVLRRSIELYYESVRGAGDEGARVLEETGFIGCADGPSDLSTRYKAELSALLASKS